MNDRDRAFKTMDALRSVLERLPEAACQSLIIYTNVEPEIQFTLGTFAFALEAFPFTKPTCGPHGSGREYNVEEFMVDGVRLFQLVKKETEESDGERNGTETPSGTGPDGKTPEEAGVEGECLAS